MTGDTAFDQTIAHQETQVTVAADSIAGVSSLEGVTCYLFTPAGSYLGISAITDGNGQALFDLPQMPYRIRADYMTRQYWSADLTWQDSVITIEHGTALAGVVRIDDPLSDIPVYVFNEGTYLNLSGITDNQGEVGFDLPSGTYRFRADYQGSQYWGEDLALIPKEENPVQISTGGGSFELTLTREEAVPIQGIRAYVFTETGSYLGEYANTDNEGRVSFNLPDGNFKIRMDYLGYQYWTDPFIVPADTGTDFVIPHRQVQVNALKGFDNVTTPIDGAMVYLFTPENTYLNISAATNSNGAAFFNLPEQDYRVRVDHLGKQYHSDPFATQEQTIAIKEGRVRIHLNTSGAVLPGVQVYVFSESDSYLGITGQTESDGSLLFQLPEGLYKFRADYQSGQFWASDWVGADTISDIELSTGGGTLALTVRSSDATVLADVTCYLFSQAGTYLGQSAVTDESGMVRFDVADGAYKIRTDYLGYQYWSDPVTAPATLSTSILIQHKDLLVSVVQDQTEAPLPGIKCYLFTESGSYTNISAVTDENGGAHFNLPDQSYKVRADYLGSRYWSDPLTGSDIAIPIAHGKINLAAFHNNAAAQGVTAYLFNESGTYLGISGTTDTNGEVHFTVPENSYQIRVDINGEQHWTEILNILPFQDNDFELTLDDETLAATANPRPKRWDGKPPAYQPLFALLGEIPPGALAQTTQIEVSDEARPLWYIADHLGTAQLITDGTGAVVWQGFYQPFGRVEGGVNQEENRFRFPGQYYDSETGLHYNYHRYYDPDTGRYLTPDPIGLAGGINPFVYSGKNPINYIDPYGLKTFGIDFSITIGAGLAGTGGTTFVIDDKFNIAIIDHGGLGGFGGAEAGGAIQAQYTNAKTVDDLEGWSVSTGGAVGPKVAATGEWITMPNNINGFNAGLNASLGPLPFEVHSLLEYSKIRWKMNLPDAISSFFKKLFNQSDENECK